MQGAHRGSSLKAFILLALAGSASAGDPAADAAVLVRTLGDPEPERREAARQALQAIGQKAVTELKRALESDDPEVRISARKLLDRMHVPSGDFDARIRELIGELERARDIRVAAQAWQKLAEIGWEAGGAVEEAFGPVPGGTPFLFLAGLRLVDRPRPVLQATLENRGDAPLWISVAGFSIRRSDQEGRRPVGLAPLDYSGDYPLLRLSPGEAIVVPFYAPPLAWGMKPGENARVEVRYDPAAKRPAQGATTEDRSLTRPDPTPIDAVAWTSSLRQPADPRPRAAENQR